jgi:hypothetical protein
VSIENPILIGSLGPFTFRVPLVLVGCVPDTQAPATRAQTKNKTVMVERLIKKLFPSSISIGFKPRQQTQRELPNIKRIDLRCGQQSV